MLTALDSRVSDANAEALGVSVRDLMGNAGRSVSDLLASRYPDSRIIFVCGSGNNGGDGFAAALDMDPSRVEVALLCEPSRIHSDESRFYYSLLECPISRYTAGMLSGFDVVVDCALGTGARGDVREPYRSFIAASSDSGTVVSVDIPSGLGTDMSVHPVATVTFHDIKEGMTRENSGEIIIADIGIPAEAVDATGPGDMLRYPVPGKCSHKGQNGRLMIVAGGPYFGAPIMASMSGVDDNRFYTHRSPFTAAVLEKLPHFFFGRRSE